MKNVIIFLSGAALGGVATWIGVKKYYEDKANEKIKEARDSFMAIKRDMEASEDATDDESVEEKNSEDEPDLSIYREALNKTNYGAMAKEAKVKDVEKLNDSQPAPPYVISLDEFNNLDSYDKETLTYYEYDDTIENEVGDILNLEDTLGDTMDEYDSIGADSIFVRNEKLGIDFEVIRVHSSYAEGTGQFYEEDEDE